MLWSLPWDLLEHICLPLLQPECSCLWKPSGTVASQAALGCVSIRRYVMMWPGSWKVLQGPSCMLNHSGGLEGERHCSLEMWLGSGMRLTKSRAPRLFISVSTVNFLHRQIFYWKFSPLHYLTWNVKISPSFCLNIVKKCVHLLVIMSVLADTCTSWHMYYMHFTELKEFFYDKRKRSLPVFKALNHW